MNGEALEQSKPRPGQRLKHLLILLAGIVLGQVFLYGPSLAGRKVLLPLDILAEPGVYLPRTPEVSKIVPQNSFLSDLLYYVEPARRFAASELHAGRLPTWGSYHYAGVPFIWPKFSPFLALEYCATSPVLLPWAQLLAAMVAGLGAYLFCRRVLGVSFWPAAIAGWCYPLTGFFVLWQGWPTALSVYWLPWILLAVDKTVRHGNCTPSEEGKPDGPGDGPSPVMTVREQGAGAPASCRLSPSEAPKPATCRRSGPFLSRTAPVGLAVVTCLVLVSGHLDVGGQVLLGSGLFALWCLQDAYPKAWFQRPARRAVRGLVLGWGLGFLLAAPYILPVLEYTHTSARMARRSAGLEERPPVGLKALPQIVLPDMYGTDRTGSVRLTTEAQAESTGAAYIGIWATLILAPLAWCSRRHRSINVFWALLCLLSFSWCLNLPGFVSFFRLPGLNMLSYNRLVFLGAFALVAMTAVGLEVLWHGSIRPSRWFWLPATVLAVLCAWCVYRAFFLPARVETELGRIIAQGGTHEWIHDMAGVARAQTWFRLYYAKAAAMCGLGVAGWLLLRRARPVWRAGLLPFAGALLLGDLLWFAHGRSAQCDPHLYFPRLPALENVAQSPPGRIIGAHCLPASLASMHGLHDIRGYDSFDPERLVELMLPGADPASASVPYALTQWLTPTAKLEAGGALRLPGVFDMLGVRYLIGRGAPPAGSHLAFEAADYWVLVNSNALPRAFVPRRVETVPDDKARLAKLAADGFDPRAVAYVESAVELPGACRGTAEIVEEIPTSIRLAVRMKTPGLVVLTDLWDQGWRAYWNGQRVPILRANHAVRGVVLPAGEGTLVFRYAPASFAWGLGLAGLAAAVLLAWLGIIFARPATYTQRVESPLP